MSVDPSIALAIRIATTLIWTIVTGLGCRAAKQNLGNAKTDRMNLFTKHPTINGIARLEADGGVDDQRFILLALLSDFLCGLIALVNILILQPAPTQASIISSLTGTAIGVILTSGAIALVWLSFSKKRRRQTQIEYLLLQSPTHPTPPVR